MPVAQPTEATTARSARQRVLPVAAAGLLAAVALSACGTKGSTGGTSGLAPKDALIRGVQALQDGTALDVNTRLALSAVDLQSIVKSDPAANGLTESQARLITGGDYQVVTRTSDGSTLSAAKPGTTDTSVAVHADGTALFEMRALGTSIYGRADVKKIAEIGGTAASRIDAQLSDVPPQLAFLKDAAQGRWLAIDGQQGQALLKQYGGQSSSLTMDPTRVARVYSDLLAAVQKDVTATRAPDTDRGDHLVLNASGRALAKDLSSTYSALLPAGQTPLMADLQSVPDKPITIDAFLQDGRLALLSLELSQFAGAKEVAALQGKKVPLQLSYSTDVPKIEAPADAVKVDLSELVKTYQRQLGGGASGGGFPAPTATS